MRVKEKQSEPRRARGESGTPSDIKIRHTHRVVSDLRRPPSRRALKWNPFDSPLSRLWNSAFLLGKTHARHKEASKTVFFYIRECQTSDSFALAHTSSCVLHSSNADNMRLIILFCLETLSNLSLSFFTRTASVLVLRLWCATKGLSFLFVLRAGNAHKEPSCFISLVEGESLPFKKHVWLLFNHMLCDLSLCF